jgi:curli biogenesis system outer membrane secretion channel CsgG
MKRNYTIVIITLAGLLISCSSGIKTTKSRGFSQPKYQKIAIMDLEGSDRAEGKALAESLVPVFMQAGFNVIERSGLEKLLQEQQLGMTGVLDSNAINKIGSIAGVQALVLGSYHIKTKNNTVTTRTWRRGLFRRARPGAARSVTTTKSAYDAISVRMVDVATGEILFSAASTEEINESNIDDFLKKLSDEIVKAFAK